MKLNKAIIAVLLYLFLLGCKQKMAKQTNEIRKESPSYGVIKISVDETFKPVIEEQIKVYKSSFPEATIEADYKSEAACFRDLQSDSVRMIITARGLTREEHQFYKQRLQYYPMESIMAYDAIAVIVNNGNNDSIFTTNTLKNILSGKTNKKAVMDGKTATSTVKFLQTHLLKNQSFGANVGAVENSEAVLNFVAENVDAIGFVGSSWLNEMHYSANNNILKKIKLALVECNLCEKGTFARPSQATITYGQYSLARPLYCIVKENTTGLGTGFYNFMSLERGQLIFRRASLAPAKIGFHKRTTKL